MLPPKKSTFNFPRWCSLKPSPKSCMSSLVSTTGDHWGGEVRLIPPVVNKKCDLAKTRVWSCRLLPVSLLKSNIILTNMMKLFFGLCLWTWCVFLTFCVKCVFVSKGFCFLRQATLQVGRSGKQPEVWLYGKGCGWEDVHWKEKVLFVALSPRSLGGTDGTDGTVDGGKSCLPFLRSTSCTRIFRRKTKGVEIGICIHSILRHSS